MRLILITLCFVAYILIVLDASQCSTDKMREMIVRACGHYRKKRGFSYTSKENKNNYIKVNSINDEVRHHKKYKVIANDTTGGILIRHKRGSYESYMYCCLNRGNCTEVLGC